MRVFVTGATGFIGSAIVHELLGAGHHVIGLARSDSGAKTLEAAGAKVQRGDLEDLESLKRGAAESDGIVHCGFVHDFTNMARSFVVDIAAIDAMAKVLEGSNKPLISTSGVLGIAQGRAATEDDPPSDHFPRKSEQAALAYATKGVRAMTVRCSPSVHGDGDHGFVPMLIDGAKKAGYAAYVGEGKNLWPAVHRLDTAVLYRLALEKGKAGAAYHAVAEEGVPVKSIADVIAKKLGLPTKSITAEEANAQLGFLGMALGFDSPASSAMSQKDLGWKPTQVGLLEDLEKGTYFAAGAK